MSEKVDLSNYEEGLEILAEKLELPIPKDNMEGRKQYILGAIANFITY